MRSCLILGAGRSGTSLVAGLLHGAGYDLGRRLLPPNAGNPRGYFEDREVNAINEALLAPHQAAPGASPRPGRHELREGERWLARLGLDAQLAPPPPELRDRMAAAAVGRPGVCRKDPRFTYTLPAWRPHLGEALLVCVFREPTRTAHSVRREVAQGDLALDWAAALELWTLQYRHVLERHRHEGEWLFLHYDQVLDGSGVARLEHALGVELDRSFVDPALRRSPADGPGSPGTTEVYAELCAAAGLASAPTPAGTPVPA